MTTTSPAPSGNPKVVQGNHIEARTPSTRRSLRSNSGTAPLVRPEPPLNDAETALLAGFTPMRSSPTTPIDPSNGSETVMEEYRRRGDALRRVTAMQLAELFEEIRERRKNPASTPSKNGTESPFVRPASPPPGNAYGKFLVIDTRLEDQKFYTTDAAWARIPHTRQAYFLEEGHRLAQVCLWETARELMPEVQNNEWLEGPCMIKFGNTDLEKTPLLNGVPKLKSNNIDQLRTSEMVKKIIYLRNAVAHPGGDYPPPQGKKIDDLIMAAQKLAVFFHDRKHAMGVRALRDKLQEEVKMSYAEIEKAYSSLKPRSGGRIGKLISRGSRRTRWALHHERLFYHILQLPDDDFKLAPLKIKKLASIWNKGGHESSEGFPRSKIITDESNYRRVPAQDNDYFRRKNAKAWDADTLEFRTYIRIFGASSKISKMTAKEMMAEVQKDLPPFWATAEENEAAELQREVELQTAVENGTFGLASARDAAAKKKEQSALHTSHQGDSQGGREEEGCGKIGKGN